MSGARDGRSARSAAAALVLAALLGAGAAAAQPLLRCGETISGTLAAAEVDAYRFPARSGDAVRIRVAGAALPSLALLAPDLAAVSPTAPLPQTGVYTVQVSGAAAGAYVLTLESVSGSLNGGGNGWPPLVCGANVADGSLGILCGQTRSGALDVAGETDTYTFFAEAGDVVTLVVGDSLASFAPVAELFGPGGAPLLLGGEAVCGPSETCASAPVPAAGVYTIRVLEPSGASTGAYTVQMSRSPCASDCEDGSDDDADGLVDFPDDLGCANPDDLSERRECNDGFDNDGDGFTDFVGGDAGCPTNNSTIEDAQCDDGRDNDGDGGIDADGGGTGVPDPYCGAPSGSVESPPTTQVPACGLGPELLGLALLARRRSR
jgi:hypothetical protein